MKLIISLKLNGKVTYYIATILIVFINGYFQACYDKNKMQVLYQEDGKNTFEDRLDDEAVFMCNLPTDISYTGIWSACARKQTCPYMCTGYTTL